MRLTLLAVFFMAAHYGVGCDCGNAPTALPSVTIDAPVDGAIINTATMRAVVVSGSCSDIGEPVSVSGPVDQSVTCRDRAWSATLDLSLAADGPLVVRVNHRSASGHDAPEASVTLNKDSSPPTVRITSPAVDTHITEVNVAAFTVAGDCSESGRTVELSGATAMTALCLANAWSASIDFSATPPGSVLVLADQNDTAGNAAAQDSRRFIKDMIVALPTVTISTPSAGTFINLTNVAAVSLSGTCSEAGQPVSLSGDASGAITCAATHDWARVIDFSAIADGPVRITATHAPASGSPMAQATRSLTKDTMAPTVTISSPAGGSVVTNAPVAIAGTCSDVGATVTLSGTTSTTTTCLGNNTWTATLNFSAAADGPVSVSADVTDAAGNPAVRTSRTFTKDTVIPPSAPTGLVVGRWGTSLTIAPPLRWNSAAGAARYELSVGTTPGGIDVTGWTNVGAVTSIALPGLTLIDTQSYFLNVRAVDSAGRTSATATSTQWKVFTNSVFASRVNYAVPPNAGNGTRAVLLSDVSGDGNADLLATGNNQQLSIFRGAGDGTFSARVDLPQGCPGQAISVADMDKNGPVDVVLTCFGTAAAIFPGLGGGSFGSRVDYLTTVQETSGMTADLNGDGFAELVTASFSTHSIGVMLNQGNGTLSSRLFISLTSDTVNNPAEPKDLVVADLTGDGKNDLAITLESNTGMFAGSMVTLLGNGDGTFGAPAFFAVPTGNALKEIALGDFNRDGSLDAAIANFGANSVAIMSGNNAGAFTPLTSLPAGTQPYGVAVADLNGDALLDVLVLNSGDATLGIFLGRGDGTFLPQSTYATAALPYRLEVKDLNGDTWPDIAVAERGNDSVGVLIMAH